jgi:hypothetical protein
MKVWCPRCDEITITEWDQIAPGEFVKRSLELRYNFLRKNKGGVRENNGYFSRIFRNSKKL